VAFGLAVSLFNIVTVRSHAARPTVERPPPGPDDHRAATTGYVDDLSRVVVRGRFDQPDGGIDVHSRWLDMLGKDTHRLAVLDAGAYLHRHDAVVRPEAGTAGRWTLSARAGRLLPPGHYGHIFLGALA